MFPKLKAGIVATALFVCSAAYAGHGSFSVTTTSVTSGQEFCASPYCSPSHGSITGTLNDGKAVKVVSEIAGGGQWYLVIDGFSSNPGSTYIDHLTAFCNGGGTRTIVPVNVVYDSGALYIDLQANNPTNTCWTSAGAHVLQILD